MCMRRCLVPDCLDLLDIDLSFFAEITIFGVQIHAHLRLRDCTFEQFSYSPARLDWYFHYRFREQLARLAKHWKIIGKVLAKWKRWSIGTELLG